MMTSHKSSTAFFRTSVLAFLILQVFAAPAFPKMLKGFLVCGPFLNGNIDAVCFKDEGSVNPVEGSQSGGMAWRKYLSMDDALTLHSQDVFGAHDDANGFVFVKIISAKDQRALLSCGSDDEARIWLNGSMVFDNGEPRGLITDQDHINLELKKGENRLLFKVNNQGGGWMLQARITDHDGKDLTGLTFDPENLLQLVPVSRAMASSAQVENNVPYHPWKAFDDDPATRWSSEPGDPQVLVADLGRLTEVSRMMIHWETAAAKDYEIGFSVDGKKWKTVFSTTNGAGGEEMITVKPENTVFIRLFGKKRLTPYGYSIYDFKVVGVPKEKTGMKITLEKPEQAVLIPRENIPAGNPSDASLGEEKPLPVIDAKASSEQFDAGQKITLAAKYAVDGDMTTRWGSDFSDNQWLELFLQRTTKLRKIVIFWQDAFPKEYSVELSQDGMSWKKIHEDLDSKGGTSTIEFRRTDTKFVRINCIKRGTEWGNSILEVQLFD
jgi:hypothetical protein